MMTKRRACVVGAGIGGLTAALALVKAGFEVQVLEQAEQLGEVGAGLQLSPNATHVFRLLGLDHEIADIASKPVRAMRTGGRAVLSGGMSDALTLDPSWALSTNSYLMGSRRFSVAEGQEMASMAAAGTLDLSCLEHRRFSLDDVNQAVETAAGLSSGFTNVIVQPSTSSHVATEN